MNLAEHTSGPSPLANNREMFEQMIRAFEHAGMPYCILAGYDGYPDHIPSDIDFMVPPEWAPRLPALLASVASQSRARLIQAIPHETTATYYVIARRDQDALVYLHPDACTDYRRRGRLWLRARAVLENRRRHPQGFWIPSAADAFVYYLIKKLDKGSLDEQQARQLCARYAEDPHACTLALRSILPTPEASVIEAAARTAGSLSSPPWIAVSEGMGRLRDALYANATPEPAPRRLRQNLRDLKRAYARCRLPTGMSLVFLGPDGCGKSSVITEVSQQLLPAFRQVEYRHLRPGLAPRRHSAPVVDPHGRPARGWLGSVLKLGHFWSSYLAGSLLWLKPRCICSTLVIFDRYYQDILADPRRYRYAAAPWLARTLGRLLPQPDLVFILDAPPEVLQARKQEVPFAESARQRDVYRALAGEFRNAVVIDAARPLEDVTADILAHIVDRMAQRTAQRLRLKP
jgi:thymidylate kinase